MPELIFVDSSSVEAIGYDSGSLELHVRFLKSGETYVYYGVEEWRYQELMQSDSKGQLSQQQHKTQLSVCETLSGRLWTGQSPNPVDSELGCSVD